MNVNNIPTKENCDILNWIEGTYELSHIERDSANYVPIYDCQEKLIEIVLEERQNRVKRRKICTEDEIGLLEQIPAIVRFQQDMIELIRDAFVRGIDLLPLVLTTEEKIVNIMKLNEDPLRCLELKFQIKKNHDQKKDLLKLFGARFGLHFESTKKIVPHHNYNPHVKHNYSVTLTGFFTPQKIEHYTSFQHIKTPLRSTNNQTRRKNEIKQDEYQEIFSYIPVYTLERILEYLVDFQDFLNLRICCKFLNFIVPLQMKFRTDIEMY